MQSPQKGREFHRDRHAMDRKLARPVDEDVSIATAGPLTPLEGP